MRWLYSFITASRDEFEETLQAIDKQDAEIFSINVIDADTVGIVYRWLP